MAIGVAAAAQVQVAAVLVPVTGRDTGVVWLQSLQVQWTAVAYLRYVHAQDK